MDVSTVISTFVLSAWLVCCTSDLSPGDILKLYTNGTTVRYTANVTNCLGSMMTGLRRDISVSYLAGVTSAGSVHSESHDTWFLTCGSEEIIKGNVYNKTEPVLRLTSLTLNEEGTVYVNLYDLVSIKGKILAWASYFCGIGQLKPEVTFIPNMTKRSKLEAYNDVLSALTSGEKLTFSVNVDDSRDDAFRYWFGQIQNFETDMESNVRFTVTVPGLGYNTVLTAVIEPTNHVTMETYTVNITSKGISDIITYKDSITNEGYFRIYI